MESVSLSEVYATVYFPGGNFVQGKVVRVSEPLTRVASEALSSVIVKSTSAPGSDSSNPDKAARSLIVITTLSGVVITNVVFGAGSG